MSRGSGTSEGVQYDGMLGGRQLKNPREQRHRLGRDKYIFRA
jgi:hypothetical protein